ncbi:MAG: ArnT family glycosyltransferase [Candidatus Aquicultorales bacterium]
MAKKKKKPAPGCEKAEAGRTPASGRAGWARFAPMLAVAAVAIGGTLLRLYRITEPFGGFHAFNEAFYLDQAVQYASTGVLSSILSPADFNNPPLYSLVLTLFVKALGATEFTARFVSVLASAASVVYLYKLGKLLYNEKIAVLSAAVLAFMPGHVMVGRNVQLEALLVFLILASAYYYVAGVSRKDPRLSALGGFLLGLGLLTKLPAVLSIVALLGWQAVRSKGLGFVWERTVQVFLGAFAVTGFSWYFYQLVLNTERFVGAQTHLASTFKLPDAWFLQNILLSEVFWMLSPPLFLTALAALIYMAVKRQSADDLVILFIGVNIAFFLFYHYHTYYILPVAPFGALAVARGLYSLGIKSWGKAALSSIAVLILGVGFSLLMLAGQKYGKTPIARIEETMRGRPDKTTLAVDAGVEGNYGPVLRQYAKKVKLIAYPPTGSVKPREGDSVFVLAQYNSVAAAQGMPAPAQILPQNEVRVVLFGVAFSQEPVSRHQFTNGAIKAEAAGSFFDFGIEEREAGSPFALFRIEDLTKTAPAAKN